MGTAVDKNSTSNLSAVDKSVGRYAAADKSGRGQTVSFQVTGDEDWSTNGDWDVSDFDLTPQTA